jgi:hypothetical protein
MIIIIFILFVFKVKGRRRGDYGLLQFYERGLVLWGEKLGDFKRGDWGMDRVI